MAAPEWTPHRPDETTRGTWRAVMPVLVPPAAWIGALGLSWLVQEFTCSASVSAGAPPPEAALFVILLSMNAVLLLVIVAAGFFSVRALREARRAKAPLMSFFGVTGIGLAVLFGFGTVLIMASPLVLEIC